LSSSSDRRSTRRVHLGRLSSSAASPLETKVAGYALVGVYALASRNLGFTSRAIGVGFHASIRAGRRRIRAVRREFHALSGRLQRANRRLDRLSRQPYRPRRR
jgi:hypothetical protein